MKAATTFQNLQSSLRLSDEDYTDAYQVLKKIMDYHPGAVRNTHLLDAISRECVRTENPSTSESAQQVLRLENALFVLTSGVGGDEPIIKRQADATYTLNYGLQS